MAISKIKIGNVEHELETKIANVNNLQNELDNKSNVGHIHDEYITENELDTKGYALASTTVHVSDSNENISTEIENDINAVLFTAQNLSEAQKAQARANIGAAAIGEVDTTLSVEGKAADAKAVGDAIISKQDKITGTAGQFVVIGNDGNVTTKTIPSAEGVDF